MRVFIFFSSPKSATIKFIFYCFFARYFVFELNILISKWKFQKIKMMEAVGGSEVIVETHRLGTSGMDNAGSVGSAVGAVVVRNATKVYGSRSNRCAVLEGLNMTIKKGEM